MIMTIDHNSCAMLFIFEMLVFTDKNVHESFTTQTSLSSQGHHTNTSLSPHSHHTATTHSFHYHHILISKMSAITFSRGSVGTPRLTGKMVTLSRRSIALCKCVPRKSGIISKEIQTNNPRTNNRRSDNPRTDNKRTENPRTQDPKAHNPRIKDSVHGPLLRHLFFTISNHCIVYHAIHQNKII